MTLTKHASSDTWENATLFPTAQSIKEFAYVRIIKSYQNHSVHIDGKVGLKAYTERNW